MFNIVYIKKAYIITKTNADGDTLYLQKPHGWTLERQNAAPIANLRDAQVLAELLKEVQLLQLAQQLYYLIGIDRVMIRDRASEQLGDQ